MARASKFGNCDNRAFFRVSGMLCALGLAAFLGSGCSSTGGDSKLGANADPLYGEKDLPKPHGVTGPTPPPQNRANMGTPSPPISTTAKGTAACLVPDPLLGAKPIAIADGKQASFETQSTGWQSIGPSNGGPGVLLQAPESGLSPVAPPTVIPVTPVAPPFGVKADSLGPTAPLASVPVVTAPTAVPPPTLGVSPVGFSDADQLQAALKVRGVIAQDQKIVPEGVCFTCRLINPQSPSFVRVYEATARDLRSAILAVLDQIDQQR